MTDVLPHRSIGAVCCFSAARLPPQRLHPAYTSCYTGPHQRQQHVPQQRPDRPPLPAPHTQQTDSTNAPPGARVCPPPARLSTQGRRSCQGSLNKQQVPPAAARMLGLLVAAAACAAASPARGARPCFSHHTGQRCALGGHANWCRCWSCTALLTRSIAVCQARHSRAYPKTLASHLSSSREGRSSEPLAMTGFACNFQCQSSLQCDKGMQQRRACLAEHGSCAACLCALRMRAETGWRHAPWSSCDQETVRVHHHAECLACASADSTS